MSAGTARSSGREWVRELALQRLREQMEIVALDPESGPADHLRSQRLGEFTIGTQLHRSESLALVQLLILYHVVTARAAIALGGGTRSGSVEVPTPVGDGREAGVPATAPSG
jgi:hypothetical protein